MSDRTPIEVFPPGEFIREELEARGWTQDVLAEVLGTSTRLVNEVITAKRAVTPETAKALGEAFDTGPQVWMNLESAYRLSLVRERDSAVARRAKLYGKVPLREMMKRHWIEPSDNIDVLEDRVLTFLGIGNLDETPTLFPHAARKSTSYEAVTPAQCAWLLRARSIARCAHAEAYSEAKLLATMSRLKNLLNDVEEIRHVPTFLAQAGIRLVVIEPIAQAKIDAAAFWLDPKSPVIAMSLRFDRIDYFWHTLLHDLHHILNKDVRHDDPPLWDYEPTRDNDEPVHERPASEQKADSGAAEFLIQQTSLDDFVARIRPLFSKRKIENFAARMEVHPGLVVGQLHYRREIPFSNLRELLAKVRNVVCGAAITDGWGYLPVLEKHSGGNT